MLYGWNRGGAKRFRGAVTLFACAGALAILAAGCARAAEAAPAAEASKPATDPFTWSATDPSVHFFAAGANGLFALAGAGGGATAQTPAATADAPGQTAAAADADGIAGLAAHDGDASVPPSCAVALEGWGLATVGFSSDGAHLTISQNKLGELHGLKVGGLWPAKDGWVLASFRDPFGDGADGEGTATSGRGGVLELSGGEIKPIDLALSEAEGNAFELFAFLPDPAKAGAWLAQFRDSSGPKVLSRWESFDRLEGDKAVGRAISREAFERALSPRPLGVAPAALVKALAGLGTAKAPSALLRLDGSDGRSVWYSWGADPSAAREYHAWIDGAGRILLLAPDGAAVYSAPGADGQSATRSFVVPLPDAAAFYGDCASFPSGSGEVIVASWQSSGTAGIAVVSALQ